MTGAASNRRAFRPAPAASPVLPGGVARHELQTGSRKLRWIETGHGQPTVVLEAGRNETSHTWAPVIPLLAGQVHVVAYDRAGLGASDKADDPDILERQLADLTTLISGVTSRPCVLAGHSWGGILVQLLAFRRPELVAALVLIDPAHEDATAILPRPARWLLRQAPKLKALTRQPDELAGAAASQPLLRQLRAAPRPFPDVPVTVISATRGFPRSMRAHWTKLQASLAGSAAQGCHITADGSGHAVHQQQPQLVAKTILKAAAAAGHAGP
jgi:pimeloyl-ACP methyl ester carboxylesterase